MDALVSLCKRRGFVFPSSEIYGGFNGFFDYGPLGAELKKNIRDCWWDDLVRRRDDVVGMQTSIIMTSPGLGSVRPRGRLHRPVGRLQGFEVQRYRADQPFFAPVAVQLNAAAVAEADTEPGIVAGTIIGYVSALESERVRDELQEKAQMVKRKKAVQGTLLPLVVKDMTEARDEEVPHPIAGHR